MDSLRPDPESKFKCCNTICIIKNCKMAVRRGMLPLTETEECSVVTMRKISVVTAIAAYKLGLSLL